MSYMDYKMSKAIVLQQYPFAAILMAAARKADTRNLEKLKAAFPEIVTELQERYNAKGGVLDDDPPRIKEAVLGVEIEP